LFEEVNKRRISMNLPLISEWKIRDVMKKYDIHANLITNEKHVDKKNMNCNYKDLIRRNWKTTKPYQKLFTDVTYFKTPTGFIYVSSIIDTYNYHVIAFHASHSNNNKLVMDMLKKLKVNVEGAILHSDHGYQYSSHVYKEWCKSHKVSISMSRKGNSLDNYPIEKHWSFLKQECLRHIGFAFRTLYLVRIQMTLYYKWFNTERINQFYISCKSKYSYNNYKKSCPTLTS
jgi:transposase InsO family protein